MRTPKTTTTTTTRSTSPWDHSSSTRERDEAKPVLLSCGNYSHSYSDFGFRLKLGASSHELSFFRRWMAVGGVISQRVCESSVRSSVSGVEKVVSARMGIGGAWVTTAPTYPLPLKTKLVVGVPFFACPEGGNKQLHQTLWPMTLTTYTSMLLEMLRACPS